MRRLPGLLGLLALAAVGLCCASVNVYVSWPTPDQLDQATDAIVEDVRPGLSSVPAQPPAGGVGQAPGGPWWASRPSGGYTGAGRILLAGWPAQAAGGTVVLAGLELKVSTPTIRRIKESLAKRLPKLLPHYESGRIGESSQGLLELLSTEGLSLKERGELQKLVKAENEDRTALYMEFLRANELDPGKLPELQKAFARSWQKAAQPGWYIQDEKGKWLKKPKPRPEGDA